MITWSNQKRKLIDLIDWEPNPRHTMEVQAGRIENSLEEFGYSQLIEIEPDNTIIDGHQRKPIMRLMDKFGPDAEIEVRVSSRKFELDERKKYIIYKHEGATGEWDYDGLANLYEVEELGEWGFPEWKIREFAPDGGIDPSLIPDGDRYTEQYGVIIICGDAVEQERVYDVMVGDGYRCRVVVT